MHEVAHPPRPVLCGPPPPLPPPPPGLFDVTKELARLVKQKVKVEKDLAGIASRLNNPAFMAKASADYVAEAQGQAAEAREKLALLEGKIAQVGSMKS